MVTQLPTNYKRKYCIMEVTVRKSCRKFYAKMYDHVKSSWDLRQTHARGKHRTLSSSSFLVNLPQLVTVAHDFSFPEQSPQFSCLLYPAILTVCPAVGAAVAFSKVCFLRH